MALNGIKSNIVLHEHSVSKFDEYKRSTEMAITLSQLVQEVKPSFTPEITEAFNAAEGVNPKLRLKELTSQDREILAYWFSRYYGVHITQMSNLRGTIKDHTKHLALDLVALTRPEVKEVTGLSKWFS